MDSQQMTLDARLFHGSSQKRKVTLINCKVRGDERSAIGKSPGADQARNKPTYPSIAGMESAKRRARELHEQALAELEGFGQAAEPLRWLSAYIIERRH